jgi:hypothetical protein
LEPVDRSVVEIFKQQSDHFEIISFAEAIGY